MKQMSLFGNSVMEDETPVSVQTVDRLSSDVVHVIERMTVQCNSAYFCEQDGLLSRDLYLLVNDVLERLGGKWRGKKKGHVFSYNPSASLNAVVSSGVRPPKKPLDYYPTPDFVVDAMLSTSWMSWFGDEQSGLRILEPSAGQGSIVVKLKKRWPNALLDTVELNEVNRRVLTSLGFSPVHADYLSYEPSDCYDLIVMNPPFSSKRGGDYIDHISRAWSHLSLGGMVISVTPVGWLYQESRKAREFRKLVFDWGYFERIDEGSFKQSGTKVSTCLVVLRKSDIPYSRRPLEGYVSWHSWAAALWLSNSLSLSRQYKSMVVSCEDGGGGFDILGRPVGSLKKNLINLYMVASRQALDVEEGIYLTSGDIDDLLEKFVDDVAEHQYYLERSSS